MIKEAMDVMCVRCGSRLSADDYMWQVIRITRDGERIYSAACSEQCAREAKSVNENIHRARLLEVEDQCIQKMKVSDWWGCEV